MGCSNLDEIEPVELIKKTQKNQPHIRLTIYKRCLQTSKIHFVFTSRYI